MKQKVLIVEPSEVIATGLKTILEGQVRFRLMEPEMGTDQLEERIVAMRPDILLINPTLIKSPADIRTDFPMAVVALVYQYVERDQLKQYDGVIDILTLSRHWHKSRRKPRSTRKATMNSPNVRPLCSCNWHKEKATKKLPMPST